jgi:hypothetical protein
MPVDPLQSRMARLEGPFEQVNRRLMKIDPRLGAVHRKTTGASMPQKKIEALDAKTDQRFSALEQTPRREDRPTLHVDGRHYPHDLIEDDGHNDLLNLPTSLTANDVRIGRTVSMSFLGLPMCF